MAAENGPGLVKEPQQSRSKDGPNQNFSTPEHGHHPDSPTQHHETSGPATTSTSNHSSPANSSIEASMSRLLIDDNKSYYVSNPLWAAMAQEVRLALH